MAKTIIGVMGPGNGATSKEIETAHHLGQLIAKENWALLTGGRNIGVMEAASKGAQQTGGLTIGILPGEEREQLSAYVDIPICTGRGSARNNINVLTSDIVIACGNGAGTSSEIMLALKAQKPLVLIHPSRHLISLLKEFSQPSPPTAQTAKEAIQLVKQWA
jgi:uncharacterized protein (TIGR00725 family)